MGKLITVIGNSGSGKTTLAKQLAKTGGYQLHVEQHIERPFQTAFAQDLKRFALPNQIDYLLLRAEQEKTVRQAEGIGIQDGGLDLDYYVFTHLFHCRGYLSREEFELCSRLYDTLRGLLPPPDLIIYLYAPLEVIKQRKMARGRELDISMVEDIETMQTLLDEWLSKVDEERIYKINSLQNQNYDALISNLVKAISLKCV